MKTFIHDIELRAWTHWCVIRISRRGGYLNQHHPDNFVVIYYYTQVTGEDRLSFDIFRLKDGKIMEHWNAQEKLLCKEQSGSSSKF